MAIFCVISHRPLLVPSRKFTYSFISSRILAYIFLNPISAFSFLFANRSLAFSSNTKTAEKSNLHPLCDLTVMNKELGCHKFKSGSPFILSYCVRKFSIKAFLGSKIMTGLS